MGTQTALQKSKGAKSEMEKRENFGRYIKEKRKEAGLSQKELAKQLFVSESAVSKWERGVSQTKRY